MTTAHREYCYRWVCQRCSEVNRHSEDDRGKVVHCHGCLNETKFTEIKYDNGAVSSLAGAMNQAVNQE